MSDQGFGDYRGDFANMSGEQNLVCQDLITEIRSVLPEPIDQDVVIALLVVAEEAIVDSTLSNSKALAYIDQLRTAVRDARARRWP